jgi:hydrogenase large subunit
MSTTANTITIDPLTRIEGHLKIQATIEDGKVVDAHSEGTLYRGFEQILIGRDPLDAVQITQRFCGVCPTPHAIASSQALDNAFGILPPDNGRIIRNIMQGANSIQSHVLHFYHLALLDYFQGPEIPPFIPRYEADYRVPKSVQKTLTEHYVLAYQTRLKAHELCAIWSGKMPHMASIIAGGVTIRPRIDNITTSLWRLKELTDFIDNVYLPDVIMLAQIYRDYLQIGSSCGNMLSYGQFDLDNEPDVTKRKRLFPMGRIVDDKLKEVNPKEIKEDLKYSKYQYSKSKHPSRSTTQPAPDKVNSYSWLKAPRYDGKAYEVGPLARIKVTYASGTNPKLNQLVDETLNTLQVGHEALCSVMGRHLARALECKIVADSMSEMILAVQLEGDICTAHEIPKKAEGMGLWGAARGALGHWIEIEDKKIARYQAVVPTTWNASPKDDKDQHGPMEFAMVGTEVEDMSNPFSLARIVRSFDPCIACAVHLLRPGKPVKEFRIV